MIDIKFEKILPTDEQIDLLFRLLVERSHVISRNTDVSFEEHRAFVLSHPYRDWFLVKFEGDFIGSIYISNENTVGINISNSENEAVVGAIVGFVKGHYQPLDAIPSVRAAVFSVNVPPTNTGLVTTLSNLGATLAQHTFFLPD